MEVPRLDNFLVWQSKFRCQCPHPRDLTNVIGLGLGSRRYILNGLQTMPMEDYSETCLFCGCCAQDQRICPRCAHTLAVKVCQN